MPTESESESEGIVHSTETKELSEVIHAQGHANVSAEHASTLEITSDDWLTPAGDCILGVEADRVPTDFDTEFIQACQSPDAKITATITVESETTGTYTERIIGSGSPGLTFDNERSHVARTSTYTDDRTVLIGGDLAAADIDRNMIDALTTGADLTLRLSVTVQAD
jgi:Uncharacterized protein conserved in archaea